MLLREVRVEVFVDARQTPIPYLVPLADRGNGMLVLSRRVYCCV